MTQPLALAGQQPQARPRASLSQLRVQSIEEMKYISVAFAQSGFFSDARDAAKTFTKMIAGAEWGLGPMAAQTGIFIVKDRPTMSAVTIAGVLKKSGVYDYELEWLARVDKKIVPVADELNDAVIGCRLTFSENGKVKGTSIFTDEDAAKAGLTSNDTYKKFGRNMYFSRALTNGARWYAPDAFGGAIYTPDEIDESIALDATGRPTNYVDPSHAALPGGTDAPADSAAPRKPLSQTALVALSKKAFEHAKITAKFGAWLETSGIAPGLSARIDPVTGKNSGLTREETFAAEDALNALLAPPAPRESPESASGTLVDDSGLPPPLSEAAAAPPAPPAPPVAADPFDIPDEPISDAQRRRIQAMFTERKVALVRMFPLRKNADERRHAFAARVLGDEAKGSSKTWSQADYKAVSDALGAVEPDEIEPPE